MRHRVIDAVLLAGSIMLAGAAGCDRGTSTSSSGKPAPAASTAEKPKPTPAPSSATTPPAAKPPAAPADPAKATGSAAGPALTLPGITFTVPEGWTSETVEPGPLAAQAAFRMSPVEGDSQPVTVRITHYPNMKGMDSANIDRWIAQVKKAGGTPYTQDEVATTVTQVGPVKLTVIDLTGTVSAGMGPGGAGLTDHRLIAAIVDHPQGPHFVKVVGPSKSMAKWEPSVMTFLKSAAVR